MGMRTSSSPESTVLVVVAKIRGCLGAQPVSTVAMRRAMTKTAAVFLNDIKYFLP